MRIVKLLSLLACVCVVGHGWGAGIVVDHTKRDITSLLLADIELAKQTLHIAYGHTSHGSQLTRAMNGLVDFANGGGKGLALPKDVFKWNNGGSGGALDLHDYFVSGDLGNPDRVTWAARTREYLDRPENSDVNVVMWSWCGQVTWAKESEISLYLQTMSELEADYEDITFVYMTGHVDGRATGHNYFKRNQQIRDYCAANDKVLYDFADIESWDMAGNYLADKLVEDDCSYDSTGDGTRDRNWAIEYQDSHAEGVDWYNSYAPHSQPLNGNLKAYAAWHLFTDIAKQRASEVPEPCTLGLIGLGGLALVGRRRR